jgi:hypothetical protein
MNNVQKHNNYTPILCPVHLSANPEVLDLNSYGQAHVSVNINLGGMKVRLTIIENKILW